MKYTENNSLHELSSPQGLTVVSHFFTKTGSHGPPWMSPCDRYSWWLQKGQCCPFSQTELTCNFQFPQIEIWQRLLTLSFLYNLSKSWNGHGCNESCTAPTALYHRLIIYLFLGSLFGMFTSVKLYESKVLWLLHGKAAGLWFVIIDPLANYMCLTGQNTT